MRYGAVCVIGLAALSLSACLPLANPVANRPDGPVVSDESLAQAQRMDDIERLISEGDYDAAELALKQAIAEGFDHPRAFHLQGRVLYVAQDYADAARWFERAINAAPRWPEPRVMLAQTFVADQRLAAAAAAFGDLDRLFYEHPYGPYGKGYVALLQDEHATAAAHFDEALKRQADFAPALAARAQVADKQGDSRLERRLLEQYRVLVPEDPHGHRRIADLDVQDGLLETARRGYERAWRLQGSKEVARALADLARRRSDKEAAQLWEKRAK